MHLNTVLEERRIVRPLSSALNQLQSAIHSPYPSDQKKKHTCSVQWYCRKIPEAWRPVWRRLPKEMEGSRTGSTGLCNTLNCLLLRHFRDDVFLLNNTKMGWSSRKIDYTHFCIINKAFSEVYLYDSPDSESEFRKSILMEIKFCSTDFKKQHSNRSRRLAICDQIA